MKSARNNQSDQLVKYWHPFHGGRHVGRLVDVTDNGYGVVQELNGRRKFTIPADDIEYLDDDQKQRGPGSPP